MCMNVVDEVEDDVLNGLCTVPLTGELVRLQKYIFKCLACVLNLGTEGGNNVHLGVESIALLAPESTTASTTPPEQRCLSSG